MKDNICVDREFGHNIIEENEVEVENVCVEGVNGVGVRQNMNKRENIYEKDSYYGCALLDELDVECDDMRTSMTTMSRKMLSVIMVNLRL